MRSRDVVVQLVVALAAGIAGAVVSALVSLVPVSAVWSFLSTPSISPGALLIWTALPWLGYLVAQRRARASAPRRRSDSRRREA